MLKDMSDARIVEKKSFQNEKRSWDLDEVKGGCLRKWKISSSDAKN